MIGDAKVKTWRCCLGGLLAAVAAWVATSDPAKALDCPKLVASGNPEYPPYLWPDPKDDGHLIGANTALMQRLGEMIGIPVEVRHIGSWARVQEEMKSGRIDLIAGAFLTMERLEYMDYVYPRIATTRSVVITLSGSPLKFKEWSDLVGRKGVTVVNNSFGEEFDRYAEEKLEIDGISKLENGLNMLVHKRADYLIYEDAPARAFAARQKIENLQEAPQEISNEDLFLTLSHHSACNSPELRGKLAQAMNRLAKEKTMDGLVAEAIKAWQAN